MFLAGISGFAGGVCLLVYQGVMYLMYNEWTQYTLLWAAEKGPDFIRDALRINPWLVDVLNSCPLFVALMALGLILFFISSWLRNRYA